jgi:hypothetical protein
MDARSRLALPRGGAMTEAESRELERWANSLPIQGYQDWYPTVDQGASADIAFTQEYARWARFFDVVMFTFRLIISGTGTAGADVTIDLPVPLNLDMTVTGPLELGSGEVIDSSATTVFGGCSIVQVTSSLTKARFIQAAATTTGSGWGTEPSFALGAGDTLIGQGFYPGAF